MAQPDPQDIANLLQCVQDLEAELAMLQGAAAAGAAARVNGAAAAAAATAAAPDYNPGAPLSEQLDLANFRAVAHGEQEGTFTGAPIITLAAHARLTNSTDQNWIYCSAIIGMKPKFKALESVKDLKNLMSLDNIIKLEEQLMDL